MDVFGIGPMELLVILILALIVLGPRQLPEAGRKLGRFMRDLRRMWLEVSSEFSRELNLNEAIRDARAMTETINSIRHPPAPAALLLGNEEKEGDKASNSPAVPQSTTAQEGDKVGGA